MDLSAMLLSSVVLWRAWFRKDFGWDEAVCLAVWVASGKARLDAAQSADIAASTLILAMNTVVSSLM